MERCHICGLSKKVLIECARCGAKTCLIDFNVKHGLCTDCLTLMFIQYEIEKYANTEIV